MATKLLRSGYDPEADKGAWHMYGSGLGMAYFCATIWLYFYPDLWVYKKGQMYVPFGGKKRFHIRFHIRPELLNKKVEVWSIKKVSNW